MNDSEAVADPNEVLAQHLPLAEKTVIDVGRGAGELVRFMRSRRAHAIGVECGEAMRQRALDADPEHHDSYREGVGQDLPFDAASADGVVFSYSLHHVPAEEMTNALREAHRVLKPGGTLYVIEPVPAGPGFETNRLIDDETVVRGLAQDALAGASELGFSLRDHVTFDTEHSYADADEWESVVVGIDPSRQASMEMHREESRQRFHDNATMRGDRYTFRQPNDLKVYIRL